MKPAYATALDSFTIPSLRVLLTQIGSQTSGTKPQLLQRLRRDLLSPKLCLPQSRAAAVAAGHRDYGSNGANGGSTRILSIDMGIRNLAFCVTDLALPDQVRYAGAAKPPVLQLSIQEWKRIAVVAPETKNHTKRDEEEHEPIGSTSGTSAMVVVDDNNDNNTERDPFSPPALAATALALVQQTFLPYGADAVLIERQRFRSGGAAAVQEWTLRVNLLEAMLWSVFATLRATGGGGATVAATANAAATATTAAATATTAAAPVVVVVDGKEADGSTSARRDEGFPRVHAVNPAKVAAFWVPGQRKIDKRDKIWAVKRWISGGGADGDDLDENVRLDFGQQAMGSRDLFVYGAKRNQKRVVSGTMAVETSTRSNKLDDLADCLLQGAAWGRWEMNRRMLLGMSKEEIVDFCNDESSRMS